MVIPVMTRGSVAALSYSTFKGDLPPGAVCLVEPFKDMPEPEDIDEALIPAWARRSIDASNQRGGRGRGRGRGQPTSPIDKGKKRFGRQR